jgi:hypothetical protein
MATTIIVIGDDGVTVTDRAEETRSSPRTSQPKRRKKSRYQAAYARNFKDLKRKHPRWSFKTLATKAHAATRRQIGGTKKGMRRKTARRAYEK